MRVEEVFDKQDTPPPQRRPNGHVRTGVTKKGNKKRGLRARLVGLLDEEVALDEEDEEDDGLVTTVDLLRRSSVLPFVAV